MVPWRSRLDCRTSTHQRFTLAGAIAPSSIIDFAIANALFPSLNFNDIAVCIASVVRRLRPSGRFYVTWFDNLDAANFEPIIHPNGITTSYADREPYYYPLGLIANVCDALGATVERVADSTQPRGESILVITKRA